MPGIEFKPSPQMRSKSIAILVSSLFVPAILFASCEKSERPNSALSESGARSSDESATWSRDTAPKAAVPAEQTPEQNAAAEAFSKHDVKKCETLRSGSEACAETYWNMEATYGFNPRACLRLGDKKKVSECETAGNLYVESYATNPAQCQKITESDARVRCIDRASVALARTADLSACETLRTEDMKRSCADDHYLQMAAMWTGWLLVCRKISNPSVRTACERTRSVAVPK